jgi:mannose-6-phosphate isomerase-like protein (cupin superfamily)
MPPKDYKIKREWGNYEIIQCGDGYKLKRMFVKPLGVIRRQIHMLRDEYWIILSGYFYAKVAGAELFPKRGDCIFVPRTVEHTLKNIGDVEGEIFEVQFGSCREIDVVYLELKPIQREGPF